MKRSRLHSSLPFFFSFLLLISAVEVRRCKMHIHVRGNTALVSNYHLVAPLYRIKHFSSAASFFLKLKTSSKKCIAKQDCFQLLALWFFFFFLFLPVPSFLVSQNKSLIPGRLLIDSGRPSWSFMVHQASDGAALLDSAGIRLRLLLSEESWTPGRKEPVAGLEKMDHIKKTTQADCKWAWESDSGERGGHRMAAGRDEEPTGLRPDAPIQHIQSFTLPWATAGVLWDSSGFFIFFSLIESFCDWQLSTLIDTEGTSSPLRGGAPG